MENNASGAIVAATISNNGSKNARSTKDGNISDKTQATKGGKLIIRLISIAAEILSSPETRRAITTPTVASNKNDN